MYEEHIAQIIIQQIKELIIRAFSQLDGKESNDYTKLYITIEDGKNEIGKLSGLSQEIMNQITALIGEKSAAKIGMVLLDSSIKNNEKNEENTQKKIIPYENKRKEAQKILRIYLSTIITHKMNQKYTKAGILTLAELKLMNILTPKVVKLLLRDQEITLSTEVFLEKVQNIIKNATSDIIKLIRNNGRNLGKTIRIPSGNKDIIKTLNATLDVMNTETCRGVGSEIIAAPDFTPSVNRSIVRNK